MKLVTSESRPKDDMHIIPLINVVFLMLAFFMISGQIQKIDNVTLTTPVSDSEVDRARTPISVSITFEEQLYVNGIPTTKSELVAQLGLPQSANNTGRQPEILLRADARIPATKTREVLNLLRGAGIERVSLATLQTLVAPTHE